MKHRKERLKRKINSLSDQKQPNTEPLTHTQFKSYKERGTEKNVNSSVSVIQKMFTFNSS